MYTFEPGSFQSFDTTYVLLLIMSNTTGHQISLFFTLSFINILVYLYLLGLLKYQFHLTSADLGGHAA